MSIEANVLYGGDYEEPKFNSFGELIVSNLKRRGNQNVIIEGVTGKRYSASDILQSSIKVANALHNYGIKKNDVVGIVTENRYEFLEIAFGTFLLNAYFAPVNVSYVGNDLLHSLNISKPRIIFTSPLAHKNIIAIRKNLDYVEEIIPFEAASFKNFINKFQNENFNIEDHISITSNMKDQTAIIFLSSGTTGKTKGCEITQYNMAVTITAYKKRINFLKKYSESLTALNITPWFHVMGLVNIFSIIMSENISTVSLSKFEPKIFLECIEKYKILFVSIPPPIVLFLSKTPMLEKYDLTSLKVIYCGAAPLKKETEIAVKNRFKNNLIILQGYGMSETTAGIIYGVHDKEVSGSTGMLEEGIYGKVIDEKGNALGPNKVGEICCKGNRIMKGYYKDSSATTAIIDKNNWLHTGDLGYYDDDKQFFVVDRLKELIKYKAFQVPPAELEGLLLSHSKILDCGVIGIPDESAGELPFAFVVKKPGVELTEQEVKDFVAKNASNAKLLRGGVKFINEIPKNPSGKILRRELRDFYKNTRSKL